MSTIKVADLQHLSNSNNSVTIASDSSVALKHSGNEKIATTATGVNITGACTATTFSGSGASLTSLPAANITGAFTSVEDSKGNVRNIPQNSQTLNYTLVAADAGKHISTTNNVTIPAGVFSTGDAITIINNSGSNVTVTCSAITTYLANNTSSKSSLLLKARGVCTFIFVSASQCYGAGAGLE